VDWKKFPVYESLPSVSICPLPNKKNHWNRQPAVWRAPITAEVALKLGRAAAYVFARLNPRCWIFWKIAELPCYNCVA
jgi:hypothetical protein